MKAAPFLVVALIAFIIGIQSGGEPDVEYREVTRTVTETEQVEVPVVPSACDDLVKISRQIMRDAATVEGASPAMLDIMSRLRIVVATEDSNEANALETELRALDGDTIDAVESLGTNQPDFDTAVAGCKS